jgi:hypothetical protein
MQNKDEPTLLLIAMEASQQSVRNKAVVTCSKLWKTRVGGRRSSRLANRTLVSFWAISVLVREFEHLRPASIVRNELGRFS